MLCVWVSVRVAELYLLGLAPRRGLKLHLLGQAPHGGLELHLLGLAPRRGLELHLLGQAPRGGLELMLAQRCLLFHLTWTCITGVTMATHLWTLTLSL